LKKRPNPTPGTLAVRKNLFLVGTERTERRESRAGRGINIRITPAVARVSVSGGGGGGGEEERVAFLRVPNDDVVQMLYGGRRRGRRRIPGNEFVRNVRKHARFALFALYCWTTKSRFATTAWRRERERDTTVFRRGSTFRLLSTRKPPLLSGFVRPHAYDT